MKLSWKTFTRIGLSVALSLLAGLAQAQAPEAGRAGPAAGRGAGPGGRFRMDPIDSRVQQRTYLFADTDETLPYAVYVPSTYSKNKKTPMVLALHGFSGSHATFMRTACVDEAEKNGFLLVGPMGYSPSGSFGMPFGGGRGGRGAAPPREGQPGGLKETDGAKVAELSEKDAMNVLAMVRKEFNVDDNRIYLMGHSLGGGGSLHMGEKYSTIWAGVAALAPAAFGFQWTADSKLKNVPLLIIQGDADTTVRPAGSQQLSEELKGLNFQNEYILLPGLDHGGIIAGSMPDVFKFFAAHTKRGSK